MTDETPAISPVLMDRGTTLGNSEDTFGRRALHVKVGNKASEQIPVSIAAIPLPAGAATEAKQDVEIAAVEAQFNPFAAPPDALSFVVTYPTVLQTVYKFYDGNGGTGTLLKTVTLNFSTAQTPGLTGGDIT